MKRSLSVRVVLRWAAASAFSQNLSQADRERAMQSLESTKKGVVDATSGLSQAQWKFKPAPDKWSVAEVTEHIAAAEDFIRGNIDRVMKAPPRPEGDDVKEVDEMVVTKVPDRT